MTLARYCDYDPIAVDGQREEADSQLSRSSMHSCSSMGYLVRSMSQATVEVMLGGGEKGRVPLTVMCGPVHLKGTGGKIKERLI